MSLTGKTALITGASRGLGRELARSLWIKGANLILVASNEKLLQLTLNGLSRSPEQKLQCIPCDFGNEKSLAELGEKLKYLNIDAVINNAATQGPIGQLGDNDWDDWKRTIQINLFAPAYICRLLVPLMVNRKTGGSIINLSGGGAVGPRAHFSAYASSKAGLVGFSATLAEELKGSGVRVNCIAPGPLPTDMLREVVEVGSDIAGENEFRLASKIVEQNSESFSRVAELCAFLISEKSKEISGKLISAIWDPWERLNELASVLNNSDIYTLRRIVPEDRGKSWGK